MHEHASPGGSGLQKGREKLHVTSLMMATLTCTVIACAAMHCRGLEAAGASRPAACAWLAALEDPAWQSACFQS